MKIDKPTEKVKIIKRYKRFLADVERSDGSILTVHCPNSGSMKTCVERGWEALISDSMNEKRKLRYTLEMTHNGKCWIGINTMIPNKLAKEAIEQGHIEELTGYNKIQTEQKYGQNSRIDLLLSNGYEKCFVEVKNVTLVENDFFLFPDAVTERGLKHLNDLLNEKKKGNRAVMFYMVQRSDGNIFKPASKIDPAYAEKLKEVHGQGVEILPYIVSVSPDEIKIEKKIPFEL
ncbi:MAG: DNA/RNA nuclease SfsA [Calditrichae bacterium]|nr:DNA/RNA nuclease SfsA [Calditrichota bacterium]MCB9057511.1 DNA/RNA nuclease SfsA [Calditrichia bacterium]